MQKNNNTFNGSTSDNSDTTGTITYPNITHPVYDEECPICNGCGHIHCPDCRKDIRCPNCGGSGKKNIYEGNTYKIYWNTPCPKMEVIC